MCGFSYSGYFSTLIFPQLGFTEVVRLICIVQLAVRDPYGVIRFKFNEKYRVLVLVRYLSYIDYT